MCHTQWEIQISNKNPGHVGRVAALQMLYDVKTAKKIQKRETTPP